MNIVQIAQTAHELNRIYCLSIGDVNQVPWDDLTEEYQETIIDGVRFHLDHPEATPEESHNNWLAKMERNGWSYGSVKNPSMKRHPCMMPFNELPNLQRTKDYLFKCIVNQLSETLIMENVDEKESAMTIDKMNELVTSAENEITKIVNELEEKIGLKIEDISFLYPDTLGPIQKFVGLHIVLN